MLIALLSRSASKVEGRVTPGMGLANIASRSAWGTSHVAFANMFAFAV